MDDCGEEERGNADACEYSVTTAIEGWMEQCGLNGSAIEGLMPLGMPLNPECHWSQDYG